MKYKKASYKKVYASPIVNNPDDEPKEEMKQTRSLGNKSSLKDHLEISPKNGHIKPYKPNRAILSDYTEFDANQHKNVLNGSIYNAMLNKKQKDLVNWLNSNVDKLPRDKKYYAHRWDKTIAGKKICIQTGLVTIKNLDKYYNYLVTGIDSLKGVALEARLNLIENLKRSLEKS